MEGGDYGKVMCRDIRRGDGRFSLWIIFICSYFRRSVRIEYK